jgi:uncharacterized protein (TIGR03435 family)
VPSAFASTGFGTFFVFSQRRKARKERQEEGAAEPDSFPALPHAIQEELGLKLDGKKGRVETLVVDHVDRTPIEN